MLTTPSCCRQDLIEDLKSELGGHFEDVILALVRPPADYLCKQLHMAMEGMGTNEHTLIEILCSRSNSEVQDIVTAYERSKSALEVCELCESLCAVPMALLSK